MESYTPRKVHGLRKTAFMDESLAFTLLSGKRNCEEWKSVLSNANQSELKTDWLGSRQLSAVQERSKVDLPLGAKQPPPTRQCAPLPHVRPSPRRQRAPRGDPAPEGNARLALTWRPRPTGQLVPSSPHVETLSHKAASTPPPRGGYV
ncbi:uncharacterized protein ACBT57_015213 [Dama dama]